VDLVGGTGDGGARGGGRGGGGPFGVGLRSSMGLSEVPVKSTIGWAATGWGVATTALGFGLGGGALTFPIS